MLTWKLIGLAVTLAVQGIAFSAQGWAANAPGITATEIKVGQTFASSGPASSFSSIPKTEAASFRKINEEGGIDGRRVNLISLG